MHLGIWVHGLEPSLAFVYLHPDLAVERFSHPLGHRAIQENEGTSTVAVIVFVPDTFNLLGKVAILLFFLTSR